MHITKLGIGLGDKVTKAHGCDDTFVLYAIGVL